MYIVTTYLNRFLQSRICLPDFVWNEDSTGEQQGRGWKSYATAYNDAPHKAGSDELDSLEGFCWEGKMSDRPSSPSPSGGTAGSTDYTELVSIDVPQDPDYPYGFARALDHSGYYTCEWNYTTTGGIKISNVGASLPIHQHDDWHDPLLTGFDSELQGAAYNFTKHPDYGEDAQTPGFKAGPGTGKAYDSVSELQNQISDWKSLNP